MSEVSQLITTNKRFYIEGSVDDIVKKIKKESIDEQTGKPSSWFYFYRLIESEYLSNFDPKERDMEIETGILIPRAGETYNRCFEIGQKVAIKKTAIKSVISQYSDIPIMTAKEIRHRHTLVLKKAMQRDREQKGTTLKSNADD